MNTVLFSGGIGVALVVALLYVVINFLKSLTHLDVPASRNSAVTQVIVWVSSFLVLLVFSRSDMSLAFGITDAVGLHNASATNLVVTALLLGSGASTLFDITKVFDGTQTAATPNMLRDDIPAD